MTLYDGTSSQSEGAPRSGLAPSTDTKRRRRKRIEHTTDAPGKSKSVATETAPAHQAFSRVALLVFCSLRQFFPAVHFLSSQQVSRITVSASHPGACCVKFPDYLMRPFFFCETVVPERFILFHDIVRLYALPSTMWSILCPCLKR